MLAFVNTDIGQIRKTNEDSYIFERPYLFGVADGMGGHVAGEIASDKAAKTVKTYFSGIDLATIDPCQAIEAAISAANREIVLLARERPEYQGMGTTLTLTYIQGNEVFWGHVGDSRLYLFHNGGMEQLTQDHSVVWELIQNGMITREEAKYHPHRNMLTRAVGTSETLRVDTGHTQWETGDYLLLCTDGLTNMVSEADIVAVVSGNQRGDGRERLAALIGKANQAGGHDNITAILLYNGEA